MRKELIFLVFFVLLVGFTSASYELGNSSHSISKEYGPTSSLRGWLNISFAGESLSSVFTDSLGNNASLDEAIAANPAFQKECQTVGCAEDYAFDEGNDQIHFILDKDVSQIVGFVVFNRIEKIIDFKFEISSDAGSSCTNQLKINFLRDEPEKDLDYEFGNNQLDDNVCETFPKNYSCFNESISTSEAVIDRSLYCQKYTIPESPGIRAGAWIRRVSDDNNVVRMYLYSLSGKNLASCEIENIPVGVGAERSCDIPYLFTEEKDYYICVFSNTDVDDAPVYYTKINNNVEPENACGFNHQPGNNYDPQTAYQIFFQPLKFKSIRTMEVNGSTNISDTNITNFVKNLIIEKYGSLDCRGGCVIPLKFLSSENNQVVFLKNVSIDYRSNVGRIPETKAYFLETSPARINADFQLMSLDNLGFSMPKEKDDINYSLYFLGNLLFSENVSIGNVPTINDINPKKAPLGYSTKFRVDINQSAGNITQYIWKFDSTQVTTTTNEASYTFNSIGTHNITVTIIDSNDKNSTRMFLINVNNPKNQIEEDLLALKGKIDSLQTKIDSFDAFENQVIDQIFNISEKTRRVEEAEVLFNAAENDSDYLEILDLLNGIEIPDDIVVSMESNPILFFPKERRIDLSSIGNITGTTYENSESDKYKKAVLGWNQKYIETKIEYKEFSSVIGSEREHLATFYKITLKDKESRDGDAYLFINKMDDLVFASEYSEIDSRYFKVIKLIGSQESFSFSTSEEIEFEDLPVFVSPPLDSLNLGFELECHYDSDCLDGETCESGICEEEEGTNKWMFFGLAMLFLIIIAFVVYIILFNWYKNKYETYLFKNRNNLFNLVTYINHQKKKGLGDYDIEKNLNKAKWNGEQITYAMKKYNGENTGMFELPFLKMIFGKKNRQAPKPIPSKGPINPMTRSIRPGSRRGPPPTRRFPPGKK